MSKILPRAIVIDLVHPSVSKEDAANRLAEATGLVTTYGGVIVVHTLQRRSVPHYKTFIGAGQTLADLVKLHKANVVIVNENIKPRQIFEIENSLRPLLSKQEMPQVWDRIDLILKIFAKHAKTAEAKLQITMASISHMGPRIFRMGMDLSQQGGGIGTRGAGETNTEMMKRHLAAQEKTIKEKLDHYSRVRQTHRQSRQRSGLKTVSVVGYTNAGKSSLVNALTRKGTYVADALFATLDTSVGKIYVPGSNKVVLISDTIGFIQDLPPQLISAFRSTLEETVQADLLLHVVDEGDPRLEEKIAVVDDILKQLGADSIPRWLVRNKADTVNAKLKKGRLPTEDEAIPEYRASSKTGDGVDALKEDIIKELGDAPPQSDK
jgi:GTP-binding protein HflX